MSVKSLRVAVNVIGGVALLGFCAYYISSFATAETRVRAMCGKMTSGMTVADLNAYAAKVGLGPPARAAGTSFVVEGKTFGRYGCRVEAADGVVKSARYDASN